MTTEAKLRTAHDSCDVAQYGNPILLPCPARKTGSMPHAIRIHANGTPDVMRWEEVHLPAPGPGEARIRHTAIGINYSDVKVAAAAAR